MEEKLALKRSSEQISMRGRDDGHIVPSHEAIYQYVYRDKQQGGELYAHLRNRGRRYRRRLATNDQRGLSLIGLASTSVLQMGRIGFASETWRSTQWWVRSSGCPANDQRPLYGAPLD